MVNGPDDVFVEREGRIERVPDRLFEGEEPVLHPSERIVAPLGLRVDQASPWVDARLPDGSRVQTRSSSALICPKAPTSRARGRRGRFLLRAAGGPVDLDRYPLRGGPRVDQVERCVRAGVREQPRALADDHGEGEQVD